MNTILPEPEYNEKNTEFAKDNYLIKTKKAIKTDFDSLLDKSFLDNYFNFNKKIEVKKKIKQNVK